MKSANASTNNPPGGNSNSNAQHWGISEIFFYQAGISFSATGSFEGNAITASSTNKMGSEFPSVTTTLNALANINAYRQNAQNKCKIEPTWAKLEP